MSNDVEAEVTAFAEVEMAAAFARKPVYRVEIYRPYTDDPDSFARTCEPWSDWTTVREWLTRKLIDAAPGTFVLVVEIEGGKETVRDRWRVDDEGHTMRAMMMTTVPETEQLGTGSATGYT